jgi:hypothetical protein
MSPFNNTTHLPNNGGGGTTTVQKGYVNSSAGFRIPFYARVWKWLYVTNDKQGSLPNRNIFIQENVTDENTADIQHDQETW